jgi:serine protease Do
MRTLAAVMAIAVFPVYCPAQDRPDLPPKSPLPLQPEIQAALKKVTPSVVSIWQGVPPRFVATGIIVTKDGLIVTAGHMRWRMDEALEIHLSGKETVKGKVLAKLKEPDLALVQITEKGAWPAVEVGLSGTLTARDPLLALGFGHTGLYGPGGTEPPCYVRLGYRWEPPPALKHGLLPTTVLIYSGDSGGPLFDLTGSLVGIASVVEADATNGQYVPSDVLLQTWKDLAGERSAPALSSAPRPIVETIAAATAQGVRAVRSGVVEIYSDGRWAGVGVYVGDGFIVTKASELGPTKAGELGPRVTVVLKNDVLSRVSVAASDPARDLALLELWDPAFTYASTALAPVDWADVKDLPAGTILAAVTPNAFTPPTGVVCVPARAIPPLPGLLPVSVKDAKGGVEITDTFDFLDRWLRQPPFPLHVGDVITHVAGVPVANRDEFIKLNGAATVGGHPRVIGEAVQVTCRRKDKTEEVTVHLRSQGREPFQKQLIRACSYRYSDFPSAIASDLAARPEHCGAPVVDADGRVVGLLIARAPYIERLILPSTEVKAAVEAMRKSATARK